MNPYLISALQLGPVVVARLVDRIPEDRLDVAAEEGRFTPRQVVAHMADWEPIDRDRIASGLSNPGGPIEAFDEMDMAIERRYELSDVAERCELLARERDKTVELVRGQKTDDWEKSVVHPERGSMSVSDLCNLIIGHDMYHIEQLTASLED